MDFYNIRLTPGQLTVISCTVLLSFGIAVRIIFLLWKRLRASEKNQQNFLNDARRKEAQFNRMLREKEKRSGFYRNLLEKLPLRAGEMISQEDPRQISRHLVKSIMDLFEPTRVVFFTAVPERRQLILTDGRSINASKFGNIYPYGKGRPGVVAQKQITMTNADFLNESLSVKRRIRECLSSECQMDILSPLMKNGQLLGVVGMKRITAPITGEEKRVFRMLANLAASAFVTSKLLSQYKTMAHCDGLTGLINKKFFMHTFANSLMTASIHSDPISIFMFDLDNFKIYNDQNGHPEGDKLLKMLAKLIRKNIRTHDVAARYGGEEFIILFPGLTGKQAYRVSESIRKRIEGHPFPHPESQPLGIISISGGIAAFPEDGDTVEALIATADRRLYQAKNKGRNCVMLSVK